MSRRDRWKHGDKLLGVGVWFGYLHANLDLVGVQTDRCFEVKKGLPLWKTLSQPAGHLFPAD